ncbi:MAG: hypothetical protein WDO56_25160 [Gammaproteobacteria bacterium]
MLTDVTVRQARPKEKEYKLWDQRVLLLVVRPTEAKGGDSATRLKARTK